MSVTVVWSLGGCRLFDQVGMSSGPPDFDLVLPV